MPFSHNKKQFKEQINNKNNFIFFKRINKFSSNPIPSFINFVENNDFGFLYESVEKGKDKGRYSICGYNTIKTLKLERKKLTVESKNKKKIYKIINNPLIKIDEVIKKNNFNKSKSLPPMAGSFFGYLSYENIYNIEKINKIKKPNKLRTPEIILFIPKYLFIFDNITNSLFIIMHFINGKQSYLDYEEAILELKNMEHNIRTNNQLDKSFDIKKKKNLFIKSNIKKNEFKKNIKRAKSYIENGDIFQVVPSQRFETNFNSRGSALYKVLRRTNPSPFMYYFNLPHFEVVGSSPEILVRIRSNKITLRPIAGTRPRGKNKKQDKKNELDLLSDKKEIAEHLMLLDLGRNDVGRVAEKGSVTVTAKFTIEKYSHVMHIVSNVEGKLKSNVSAIKALMAGFPAGTVTGAPKIRAMQIIDELEKDCRGIYSGGIGYISPEGDMDTCIAIRTGIIKKNKLYVQAGGGVVYDSNPELEYNETVNKARAVLNAAEIVLGNKL